MSNYPPGFGSASDLDHVEGPLREEELEEHCPKCYRHDSLIRSWWRSGGASVDCNECDYHRDEEDW